MYTPLDNHWCRDCIYAGRKDGDGELLKIKSAIFCSVRGEAYAAFALPCDKFHADRARRVSTGIGLIKILKEKKEQ